MSDERPSSRSQSIENAKLNRYMILCLHPLISCPLFLVHRFQSSTHIRRPGRACVGPSASVFRPDSCQLQNQPPAPTGFTDQARWRLSADRAPGRPCNSVRTIGMPMLDHKRRRRCWRHFLRDAGELHKQQPGALPSADGIASAAEHQMLRPRTTDLLIGNCYLQLIRRPRATSLTMV
jgi:hypothetical protein